MYGSIISSFGGLPAERLKNEPLTSKLVRIPKLRECFLKEKGEKMVANRGRMKEILMNFDRDFENLIRTQSKEPYLMTDEFSSLAKWERERYDLEERWVKEMKKLVFQ